MSVSTELLAILVTIACGIMTINMIVMRLLWSHMMKLQQDQSDIAEDLATKADIVTYCGPKEDKLAENVCKKLDEIRQRLDRIWDRLYHHSHDKDGNVIVM